MIELKNYEEFKKKVWLGYLFELKDEVSVLYSFYVSKKAELESLFIKAKEESEIWKILIDQFNTRFHVPFRVELANQEDIILKESLPVLTFLYSDRAESPVQQERDTLFNNVLSRGEKRALYILQILFDIESKKVSHGEIFAVFDDVADSFDYKNKYAIIEYLKELSDSGNFKILILTHNFDFYRTVASRLSLPRNNAVLMATRQENGDVILQKGEYVNDIFQYFLRRFNEQRVFVSLIPFLRNIIEYTEGGNSVEYQTLTSCLHKKADTDSISVDNILDIWRQRFPKYQSKFQNIIFSTTPIKDVIYNVAETVITEQTSNEIPLENKIALSIAIRLKAEEFMIANVNNTALGSITSNQTPQLLSLYKSTSPDKGKLKILDKVILMTPENIHLNAFMYEPLIDVSLHHLTSLYNDIKTL